MKERLKNNLSLKLLAFLFAFLLWLMVVNVDDPIKMKTFEGIPVVVEHEEFITTKDLKTYQIIDNTQTVSVTVSARRSQLRKIDKEDIVATADMRELYLDTLVPIEVNIPGHGFEGAEANPRNLRVQIENNASATFPITAIATGTLRDGYVLGALTADPERVTLNGPESVIERISRVVAEVDVSGMSQNVMLESSLMLYDADNNIIDQSLLGNNLGKIGVSVKVELFKTKSVDVAVDTSLVEAAEGFSIAEITSSPKEIQIAGPKNLLSDINEIVIPAEVIASEAVSQRIEKIVDVAGYLPEGIRLADETNGTILVTISVEREGTKNYNLPIGSISVQNLKNDLTMIYETTDDIEVHVRGPRAVLTSFDIETAVSIDLKEYRQPGKYAVPLIIELPEGCMLENNIIVRIELTEKE